MLSEQKLINEMLQDEEVKSFIDQEKITNDEFERYLSNFLSFFIAKKKCLKCGGNCVQERKFMMPKLSKDGLYIDLDYVDCPYKANDYQANILFFSTIFSENKDLYLNEARQDVLKYIQKYLQNLKLDAKGLYLYGKYGTGKSFIMQYLAIELAKRDYQVAFVYYPDFSRRIKSMMTSGNMEDVIDDLKRVDFLFLDDLGGDANSQFVRDEVLLPILQYRMINHKPLFATSNLTMDALLEHLSNSSSGIEVAKASRMIERIRQLCKPMELKDQNYR